MSYDENITEIINIKTKNDSNSSKSSKNSTAISLVGSIGDGAKELGEATAQSKIGVKETAIGLKMLGKRMGLVANTVDIINAITSNNPKYEIPKAVAKMGGSMALGSAAVGLLSGVVFSNPLTAAVVIFTTAAIASYAGSEGVSVLFDKLFRNGLSTSNNPTIPQLIISNPIISEKSDVATFNIKLRRPLDYDLELRVKTNNGSAKSGKDYVGVNDVVIIKAGGTSYKYDVKIVDDTEIEEAENFSLSVQSINKTDGNDFGYYAFGVATILDDDSEPYAITISRPEAYETDGKIKFNITLSKPLEDDLYLTINTVDETAVAGEDYAGRENDTIKIEAGKTVFEYEIDIAQDDIYENKEIFGLFAQIKDSKMMEKYNLNSFYISYATILDFPQEECPTTPKPNIKPISLNLPPTLLYPTTGGGSWGSGGSWSGGGGWGSGGYYPLAPSKPSLPNVPYIECYNEPYLNSMMIVKLPSLNSTRSFVALNYMSKDNSFNLSSPLLKDSLNSLNNKALNLNTTTSNSNKIYFDMNSDGFKERMIEWINEDEAVLVNDINNNGLIDNGTEILGNNYISNLTGSKSLDSYLLLKEFDTNKDGVIDIKDNSNLALWQDKNKNGITDKGELTYIGKDNSPIKSISINPLDTLLSAYDRNHDFKIDNKDIIYNYIYYKDNLDNSIDLYIYGDDSAKSFLDFNTTNHTILTNQGIKRVNEIHFYEDELNLNNIANGDNLNNKLVGNSYANLLKF